MPVSTRFGIDYPLGTEAPDIDGDILKVVNGIESLAAQFGQGTFAARPVSTPGSPGKQGRFYVVTSGAEVGQVHYDYGTGWIWINNIPSIGADSITATELAANSVGSSEIAADAVGDSELADNVVSAAHLVNALKPSTGAGAGAEALRALGMGAALALSQAEITNINRVGLLSGRPAANTVVSGTQFYATDQIVQYISNAVSWFRTGVPAGTPLPWPSNTIPTGFVLYDGAALPSTSGIYADIFAIIGATTPNWKGRGLMGRDAAQAEFDVILEQGGAKTHTLTVAEMPSHQHNGVMTGSRQSGGGAFDAAALNSSGFTDFTGGGGAHNNMHPYAVVNWIGKL